jgi:hypothetical protein
MLAALHCAAAQIPHIGPPRKLACDTTNSDVI